MRKYPPLLERLWSRVRVDPSGCWLWFGSPASSGYGQIRQAGKALSVHRVSWELANGPIPLGIQVCHKCDVKLCVRPSHLFLGTQADNIADKVAKGRQARGNRSGRYTHPETTARGERHGSRTKPERLARGERAGSAKLTDEEVREVRRLRRVGWTLERLAGEYGVRIGTVHFIVTGKTWRHLL